MADQKTTMDSTGRLDKLEKGQQQRILPSVSLDLDDFEKLEAGDSTRAAARRSIAANAESTPRDARRGNSPSRPSRNHHSRYRSSSQDHGQVRRVSLDDSVEGGEATPAKRSPVFAERHHAFFSSDFFRPLERLQRKLSALRGTRSERRVPEDVPEDASGGGPLEI